MSDHMDAAHALIVMKLRQVHGILSDGPDDSDNAMAEGLMFEAIELAVGLGRTAPDAQEPTP